MSQYSLVRANPPKFDDLITVLKGVTWWDAACNIMHPVATAVSVKYLISRGAPSTVFQTLLTLHPKPRELVEETDADGNTCLHYFLKAWYGSWGANERHDIYQLLIGAYPDALAVLNSDLHLPCCLHSGTTVPIVRDTNKRLEFLVWRSLIDSLTMTCRRLRDEEEGVDDKEKVKDKYEDTTNALEPGPALFVRVINHFKSTLQHLLAQHVLSFVPITRSTVIVEKVHDSDKPSQVIERETTTAEVISMISRGGSKRSMEWGLEETFEEWEVGKVGMFRKKRVKREE